ncbi:hydantoinase B/oxoprolinase family protein [Bacillota bacterium Meth-B3]
MIKRKAIDSITVEIVGNLLLSIAEEMGVALIKSSYSSNIKERKDCSTAVFDASGNLVAQAEHIPMHLGSMSDSILSIIDKFGVGNIREGDMFIANDSYNGGGSHLPDIVFAAPVFADGKLIMWVANIAHHSDIGGIVPGSTSGEVTTIFQEGLRLPPIYACRDGRIIPDIFDIIVGNCRTPAQRTGDLNAQVAANITGIKRVKEAYAKYADVLLDASSDLQDYAENALRAGIARIPEGTYHFTEYVDDPPQPPADGEITIDVEITVEKGHMTLDFSRSSRQVEKNINITYGALMTTVFYALKALIGPKIPSNAGIFRVFDVIATPGTIVSSLSPAPLGERMSACQRVVEAIFGALYPAMPGRVPACSHDGGTSVNLSGINPRTNDLFIYPEGIAGGEGAFSYRDGMSGIQVHMTNTSNQPIEALEAENPILIESYSLIRDSGGAGKHRGGLGIERVFGFLADGVTFTGHGGRMRMGAWGQANGLPGAVGGFFLLSEGRAPERLPSMCDQVVVGRDDRICVRTPGGGGFGNPLERAKALVARDLDDGKVSSDQARALYGYSL